MDLVESELTTKNVERAQAAPEFEQRNETEQKLVPQYPELLELLYKDSAYPIEQIYISNPHDESSLRVRADYRPDGVRYTSTLKTRGVIINGALKRIEIETPISKEGFEYYQQMNLPTVHKLRAKLGNGVTIDFFDKTSPVPVLVEVEGESSEARAQAILGLQEASGQILIDRSDDTTLTNESIAYQAWLAAGNKEHKSPESLEMFVDRVVEEMVANYAIGRPQVVTGLTGMSGSGKTTVTNAIQERIVELFGDSFKPVTISTDDYHYGKEALEQEYGAPYTAWDHPRTYNTAELASKLEQLSRGESIEERYFDFKSEEPQVSGKQIKHSPFVLIEGLYAGSKDLQSVRTLHFKLPSTVATSVSRDIRRLIIDNRANNAFRTPEDRLKYLMENAIPLYDRQEEPHEQTFSESSRVLAERAFMLTAIKS